MKILCVSGLMYLKKRWPWAQQTFLNFISTNRSPFPISLIRRNWCEYAQDIKLVSLEILYSLLFRNVLTLFDRFWHFWTFFDICVESYVFFVLRTTANRCEPPLPIVYISPLIKFYIVYIFIPRKRHPDKVSSFVSPKRDQHKLPVFNRQTLNRVRVSDTVSHFSAIPVWLSTMSKFQSFSHNRLVQHNASY